MLNSYNVAHVNTTTIYNESSKKGISSLTSKESYLRNYRQESCCCIIGISCERTRRSERERAGVSRIWPHIKCTSFPCVRSRSIQKLRQMQPTQSLIINTHHISPHLAAKSKKRDKQPRPNRSTQSAE